MKVDIIEAGFAAASPGDFEAIATEASLAPDGGRAQSYEEAQLPDSLRNFDHSGTGFPLAGAHARTRCESCHDARSWRVPAFDHTATRFALTGVFVARTPNGDVRVAATGASQSGVMRVGAVEAALHGVGQVMFQASLLTGVLFLVGIAVSDRRHAG